jgi:hypothetical protein
MRKANSELYMRKSKIEKDCTNMARQLKAQKAKTNQERSKVVERMQMVFERKTAVALSDATVQDDLKKSERGVEGLKYILGKSEVHFAFVSLLLSLVLHFFLCFCSCMCLM